MARILFFVSSMQGGGAERVAALLSNQWAAGGHEVTLVATFSGRGECKYPLSRGVQLIYLADRMRLRRKSLWTQVLRLLAVRRLVREDNPHVVVSFLSRVNVSVLLACLGLDVRVVVSERTFPPMVPLGFVLEKVRARMYARASVVVVQTQKALQWLQAVSPAANGLVIANPVVYPVPLAQPVRDPGAAIGASRRLLIAVGRLDRDKGFDALLAAFAQVATSFDEWDMVILGEGDARGSLQQQIEQLALNARVALPGEVGNIADWYDRADVFVMSSRFEGFPNGLIEAMAHGLPVISYACDAGPEEIIRHDHDGILVPPEEGVDGLSQALQLLMSEPEMRDRLGAQARQVCDRYQLERIARQWQQPLGL